MVKKRPERGPIYSWGRVVRREYDLKWLETPPPRLEIPAGRTALAYGLGRSYGDCCLNRNGLMLMTEAMTRDIELNMAAGTVRASAGVSLDQLLRHIVPAGFFLPVTPGTRLVTLGGAVANDVHGKNHHSGGSFGCHVRRLALVRSEGTVICSPLENAELFHATIGGIGLTGLIAWVELALRPIRSSYLEVEEIKFGDLDEFFSLSEESRDWEHTVAWADWTSESRLFGRGIFMRGRHVEDPERGLKVHRAPLARVPLDAPNLFLNSWAIRSFNTLYFHRRPRKTSRFVAHYDPFFYPLDVLNDWNRFYGPRGFFQYQCVLPRRVEKSGLAAVARQLKTSPERCYLTILKTFGDRDSGGMIAFPRPGAFSALDFANNGRPTRELFASLDAIVREAGGALYAAKDGVMDEKMFRLGYPRWEEFQRHVDPALDSDLWRRVTGRVSGRG